MKKVLLPVITSILFAGSFIAGKYTTLELEPLTTSFLRYLIAILFLSSLIFRFGKSKLKIVKKDFPLFILLGASGIVGYHYFFFLALRYTEVANTAIINALSPVFTALMAVLFIRERLSAKNYLGVLLAVIGVLTLISKGDVSTILSLDFASGDLLMLCSVVSWVVYALLVKSLSNRYHGFTITFYATLFGVILLFFLALTEDMVAQVSAISSRALYSVLYMGIGASGIGYLLYNLSIKEVGPTRTSGMVYSLVPVFVAVLSAFFFNEPITVVMVISTSIILAGLHATLHVNKN